MQGVVSWSGMPPVRTLLAKASSEPAVVALVAVVAFAVRFYQLGSDPLWLDEAITYHRSTARLSRVIESSQAHHHNPAYFLFMHAWLKLGDSEFMMRAPSAFFGALTVPMGYALGRLVGGRWVALGAALTLVLHPRLLAYSQEARMYGVYVFAAAVAMLGLLWLVAHPTEVTHPFIPRRWRGDRQVGTRATLAWLGCTFGWVVSLYCHATAGLFVVACAVVALVRLAVVPGDRVRFFVSYSVANLLALLVYLPWLLRLAGQVRRFKEKFWAVFPSSERIVSETTLALFLGGQVWRWLLVLALALLGSYVLRKKPLVLASLWLFSLLGPGLVLAVSFWQPMFMHRQFLWAAVPFGALVGAGIVAPTFVAARVALLGVSLVAGSVALHVEYFKPPRKEAWPDLIAFLRPQLRPGERVLVATQGAALVIEYYFDRKSKPMKRFKYNIARRVTDLPIPVRRRGLWLVNRRKSDWLKTVKDGLTERGWQQVDTKKFRNGIGATYYRPARRARASRTPTR
jgi:4-amino-4-deoxy-L-arabinose transferase-like glycosyltransferase